MSAEIRVGFAGWDHTHWKGIFYPADAKSKFDKLGFVARYFDTLEINSTYHRPPAAHCCEDWLKKVEHNPSFKFTAKISDVFTHKRGPDLSKSEEEFRRGIEPLMKADKLGVLLLQFAHSFTNIPENREYLVELLARFKDYPLVVEVRHVSWDKPFVYQSLKNREVGFCNIDQPIFDSTIRPSAIVTSPVGYVRLHGRNSRNWFRKLPNYGLKYDYLYSEAELTPWIERIASMSSSANQIYVQANNILHAHGATNAFEIKAAITKSKVRVPETLLKAFPRLEKIALAA